MKPKANIISPFMSPGKKYFFCSSVPAASIAGAPLPAPPTVMPILANSSSTIYWSILLPSCPPYSSGQLIPIHPFSEIFLYNASTCGPRLLIPDSSISSRISGVILSAINCLTSSRRDSCSGVYAKSIRPPVRWDDMPD